MLYQRRSKHLISLIASTSLALFAQTSHAHLGQLTYFGGQIGGSDLHYSASNQGFPDASSSESGDLAWRVFGGYQMNANFAIEAGFIEYNDVTIKNIGGDSEAKAKISQKSTDLMGKLIYPMNSLFEVYVKGGIAYAVADKKVNRVAKAQGAKLSDSHGLEIAYGLGASYEFYPNTKVDLTWQRVASGGGIKDADFAGIGITLFFG